MFELRKNDRDYQRFIKVSNQALLDGSVPLIDYKNYKQLKTVTTTFYLDGNLYQITYIL